MINEKIYQKIRDEVGKKYSPFIINRDKNISIVKGSLFNLALEQFPPYLTNSRRNLDDLFTVAYHKPSKNLIIASRGASIISKSILSGKYFIVYHVGMIVFIPNHGIEMIDVGIAGNIRRSKKLIVRAESACTPSFIFGSQRCNCYDQWLLIQKIAAYYNNFQIPKIQAQKLEKYVSSYYNLDDYGIPVPGDNNQAVMMIHFESQNGMGSGINHQKYTNELTLCSNMRHRAEYSSEQYYGTSMAGGFRAIGLSPDPRKLNRGAAYNLIGVVLDYFRSPKNVVLFTNNRKKVESLEKFKYKVKRLSITGRLDRFDRIETRDRRVEFNHQISDNLNNIDYKSDFKKIISKLGHEIKN